MCRQNETLLDGCNWESTPFHVLLMSLLSWPQPVELLLSEVLLPPLALGFIVLFLWKFGWLELQLSQRREVILRHFGEKINLSGRFYGQAGRHCFWTLPAW